MAFRRSLNREEAAYAHQWELTRAAYYRRLGEPYKQQADDCEFAAAAHLSRMRSLEQEGNSQSRH